MKWRLFDSMLLLRGETKIQVGMNDLSHEEHWFDVVWKLFNKTICSGFL